MLGVLETLGFCVPAVGLGDLVVRRAVGLGDLVVRRAVVDISVGERIALSGAVGLGITAYSMLLLGLLGGFGPAIYGLTTVVVLLGLYGIRGVRCSFGSFGLPGVAFGLCMLLFAVLALMGSACPVDSSEWDSVAYHLAVPKLYLAAHRIEYIPFIHHSNFPFLTEMLYTWGLFIGGIGAAKAFHAVFCALMLLGTFGFASRHGGRVAGAIAVGVLAATPMVLWEAGTAYIDLATGCYAALAAFLGYEAFVAGNARAALLAGLLGGFCVGTKSTAMLVVGGIALAFVIRRPKLVLSYALAAAVVAAPWFVKSFVYTGNPVYPFFYGVFDGRNWSEANARQYTEEQNSFGVGRDLAERRSLAAFVMLPWNMAAFIPPSNYPPTPTYGFTNRGTPFAQTGALYGALLLILPVLRRGRPVTFLLFVSLVVVLCWFFLSQQARYLTMVMPLLAVAYGIGAGRSLTPSKGIVALFFAAILTQSGLALREYLPRYALRHAISLAGGLSPMEYLRKVDPELYDVTSAVNALPANAKVLLIDEVRGFYLERRYVWGNPGHHTLIPYGRFTTPQELVGFLRSAGFTHVLFNVRQGPRTDLQSLSSEPWRDLFREAVDQNLMHRVDVSNESAVVYAL